MNDRIVTHFIDDIFNVIVGGCYSWGVGPR